MSFWDDWDSINTNPYSGNYTAPAPVVPTPAPPPLMGLPAAWSAPAPAPYIAPPPPPPPPAPSPAPFQYTLTSLGQQMNGGATQVAAAPPIAQAVSAQAPAPSPAFGDYRNQINDLYQKYMGRDMAQSEIDTWANTFSGMNGVEDAIKGWGAPWTKNTLDSWYQQYGGRAMSDGEYNTWQNSLANGYGLNSARNDIQNWFIGHPTPTAPPPAPIAPATPFIDAPYNPPPPPAPAPTGYTQGTPPVYSSFNDVAGEVPGYSTNSYGPISTGGKYNFYSNNLTNWNPQQMQNSASAANGSDIFTSPWSRFADAAGNPLAAFKDGNNFRVFSDPGDFGGTGIQGQKLGKMAGINYDLYDPTGKYLSNGTFSAADGWKDENMGDALGVGSIIAMAVGAAAGGLGGAAGATGGELGGATAAGGLGASDAAAAAAAASEGLGAGAGLGALGVGDAAGMAGSGAFLGSEAGLSGIGAWDAALSAALPAGAAAGSGEISKALLDGTNSFGANSAPNALDISALNAAAPGVASQQALSDIVQNLGYTAPAAGIPQGGTPSTGTPQGVPPPANPNVTGGLPNLGNLGSLGQIIGALTGGGTGAGGTGAGGLGGLGALLPLLGGLYGANQQGNAANEMKTWLQGQQAKIDNLYNPGTPEYNALWDQMSRKDAAAGRNSQYGPRSVDLAARVAGIKADETQRFTSGTSRAYADALNQNAAKYSGLMGALGANNMAGGVQNLSSLVQSLLSGGSTNLGSGMSIGPDGSINGIGNDGWTGGTMSNDDINAIINGYGSADPSDPFSLFW